MNARWLASVALLALPACGVAHHDIGALGFEQRISRDVDILFVLDSSVSAGPGMADLGPAMATFAGALQNGADSLASYHIGFITSDMGTPGDLTSKGNDGALLANPGALLSGSFIASEQANFTPPLADALVHVFPSIHLGDGTPVQQPFAAVKRALDPMHPLNAGFLRQTAELLVVFVAGQDDCSPAASSSLGTPDAGGADAGGAPWTPYRCAQLGITCDGRALPETVTSQTPVALVDCQVRDDGPLMGIDDLSSFLETPKSFEGQVSVLLVAAPTEPFQVLATAADSTAGDALVSTIQPSCRQPDPNGRPAWGALPPVRLQRLVDDYRSEQVSAGASTCICSADPQAALATCAYGSFVDRMTSAARTLLARGKCLQQAPHLDATDAGSNRAQCDVTTVVPDGPAETSADAGATVAPADSVPVPSCDDDSTVLCWRVVPDHVNCVESGFALEVDGPNRTHPISGTFAVHCSR